MTQEPDPEKKTCFVVCPIGPTGSDIRLRSDQVLRHIIRPAAEPFGYEVRRSDEIDKPGVITNEVINRVLSADLVIADLTGPNPNVMYELGIRHATGKPTIHICEQDRENTLPFDIAQHRAIFVNHHDLDSAVECRESIARQIQTITENPSAFDNPVTTAVAITNLQESDNPNEQILATIIEGMADIRDELARLRHPSHLVTHSDSRRRREIDGSSHNVQSDDEAALVLESMERLILNGSVTGEIAQSMLLVVDQMSSEPNLRGNPRIRELLLRIGDRLRHIAIMRDVAFAANDEP